ncbi:MAG: hypothetical protein WDN04_19000 [Rhodospirillales bacterium]
MRRLRLGRITAVLLAVLLALGVIVAVGTVIGLELASLSSDLPRYETAMREKIATSARPGRQRFRSHGKAPGCEDRSRASGGGARMYPHVPNGTVQSPVTVEVQEAQPTALGYRQADPGTGCWGRSAPRRWCWWSRCSFCCRKTICATA